MASTIVEFIVGEGYDRGENSGGGALKGGRDVSLDSSTVTVTRRSELTVYYGLLECWLLSLGLMLTWSLRLVPNVGRPTTQDIKPSIHGLPGSKDIFHGAYGHSRGRKVGSNTASWAMILEQGLALDELLEMMEASRGVTGHRPTI